MKFNREMGRKWLIPPLVLMSCQVHAAEADAPAKPAGVATFGQLDALRSQNALLAEELKNAELKSKIKGGGAGLATPAGGSAFPGMGMQPPAAPFQGAPAAPAPKATPEPSLPARASADVQMVSSDRDGRLVALLSLQDGRQVKARVGSTIPSVGTVQRISVDEVVVSTPKGKTVSLLFSSEPTTLPAPNTSATPMPMMGMPSLSTVMPPIPRGGR